MIAPEMPDDEPTRLATLRDLNLLDREPEERFDRLTRLAKRLFGVPIAVVSLVDGERQWTMSSAGMDRLGVPRAVSFCGHAILTDGMMMVPDAHADPRFHDNPLVTELHVRFYAGYPLSMPNGSKIGTLCLFDMVPRSLDAEECALLRDLATMAEGEIAALQLASMDELTQLSNRRGFDALAHHALSLCRRLDKPATLLYFDLNDFKKINDTCGHAVGDCVLASFAAQLRGIFRDSDVIGRLGGDEFAVLLTNSNATETHTAIARLRESIVAHNQQAGTSCQICFSIGQTDFVPQRHESIAALLAEADALMYANKRAVKLSTPG